MSTNTPTPVTTTPAPTSDDATGSRPAASRLRVIAAGLASDTGRTTAPFAPVGVPGPPFAGPPPRASRPPCIHPPGGW
jgi:hypothetical protein